VPIVRKKLLIGALAAASVAAVPALPSVATAGGGDATARSGGASPPSAVAAKRSCDPNYKGRCLRRNAGDYDCAGGSGNGPNYVSGPFRVVGSDPHRLDSDGDGIACES
jgi:hypothetical protein